MADTKLKRGTRSARATALAGETSSDPHVTDAADLHRPSEPAPASDTQSHAMGAGMPTATTAQGRGGQSTGGPTLPILPTSPQGAAPGPDCVPSGGGSAGRVVVSQMDRVTPEVLQAIEDRMVQDAIPFPVAAQMAGISLRTAQGWESLALGRTTRWPDGSPLSDRAQAFLTLLAEAIGRAKARCEAQVLANIAQAARSTNEKTGIPEWRAGAWILEHSPYYKRDYAEYREQRIEHAGQVNHAVRAVREMDDSRLIELAGPEFAELVPSYKEGEQA